MRLLVITQKVDKNDSVLGFFHRWLEEFSKQCESVVVICLAKGEYSLPANVEVYSLGKEAGFSKSHMALRFLSLIWELRKKYDAVFVHMNAEYVFLGGKIWRLMGKRLALWYNHPKGSWYLKASAWLPQVIFHTSPFAYSARYKKAVRAPAGIDLTQFYKKENETSNPSSILYIGRIAPVKHVEDFINALLELHNRDLVFHASIVGDSLPIDRAYVDRMHDLARPLETRGLLTWRPGVSHEKTRDEYVRHSVYVNLTPSGSFDKTILEAMASESLVVTSNDAFKGIVAEWGIVRAHDPRSVADGIQQALSITDKGQGYIGKELRKYVEANHSLRTTVALIVEKLSKK